MSKAYVLVLGNVLEDTNDQANEIAKQNNAINYGLLSRNTPVGDPGIYHTTVIDLNSGEIINLAKKQFDTVIMLDQPADEWGHSKLLLSTYKIMIELENSDCELVYKANENIKSIEFFTTLFQENKSFCMYPWLTYNDEHGHLRLCARDEAKVQDIDKLSDWRTDPEFTKIREKMLQGQKLPEHCNYCYDYEEQGVISYRQHDSMDYIAKLNITSFEDLNKIENPYYYEIRPSNKCNLMCRMCKPRYSHLLQREFEANKELYTPEQEPYNNDEESYSNIDKIKIDTLTDKHTVYLAGGEPTVMKEVYQFMETCIAKNKTNFLLTLGTNAFKLNNRFLELASHFSQMHFSISVDGYKKINDYIRWNSDFDTIMGNANLLKARGHAITFNHVPTIWGIHAEHLLFEYFDKHFPDESIYLQFNRVGLTSAFCFPKPELVIESMERCKQTNVYYSDGKSLKTGIDSVYDHYLNYTPDLDHLKKFFKWNDKMDQVRNIELKDYIPELAECRSLLGEM